MIYRVQDGRLLLCPPRAYKVRAGPKDRGGYTLLISYKGYPDYSEEGHFTTTEAAIEAYTAEKELAKEILESVKPQAPPIEPNGG